MRKVMLLVLVAVLCGCSRTLVVPVPPRVDLKGYGTLGIVDFVSNADRATSVRATRQFQEQVQAAQPGTRFLELGDRDTVLAAVGATQLDPQVLRKIGEKYGVSAVFLGDVVYSEPRMDVKVSDVYKLEGGVRAEVKGDISSRLIETASGASVWSSSAWATRSLGSVKLSADQGVTGAISKANPREEMVPALVRQLTHDFRATTVREAR